MKPAKPLTHAQSVAQDAHWMQAAQMNDRCAFDYLLAKHGQEIEAHCLRDMHFNVDDGLDAAADVYRLAWVNIHTFQQPETLGPTQRPVPAWFHAIVKNRCLEIFRDREKKTLLNADVDQDTLERIEDGAANHSPAVILEDIWRKMEPLMQQRLYSNERRICRLHLQHGMSLADIAEVLEINYSTVRSSKTKIVKVVKYIMMELDIYFPASLQGHALAQIADEEESNE